MTLKDMISTLRTVAYESFFFKHEAAYEILTCPTTSESWKQYQDHKIIEWFPHGAPKKDATFTVLIE